MLLPIGLRSMQAVTGGLACLLLCAACSATLPAPRAPMSIEARSRALSRASDAVLGLRSLAVDGARSAPVLGSEREGSGVLISDDGLVLTIGTLLLEADAVELLTDDGHTIPARVVALDVATGFGLVQALAPLHRAPVPLGDPAALDRSGPLVAVSGGADAAVSTVRLLSRRPYAGSWEYAIDGALFTAPPRRDLAGGGLFDLRGELVGIGALVVDDALGAEAGHVTGNLFVPVDLLRPILGELLRQGHSRASERAWLGIHCLDRDGGLRIVQVVEDSPADVAGLQAGDRILRIDGVAVTRLGALWQRLWAGGPAERAVRLDIERDGQPQTLVVQTVDRAKTLRHAQGI